MIKTCDYVAAIVKGLYEHKDGTAYFGSLIGYSYYFEQAVSRGLVERAGSSVELTDGGNKFYFEERLARFPKRRGSRANQWNWA